MLLQLRIVPAQIIPRPLGEGALLRGELEGGEGLPVGLVLRQRVAQVVGDPGHHRRFRQGPRLLQRPLPALRGRSVILLGMGCPGERVERRYRFCRPRIGCQRLVRGLLRLGVLARHRRGLGQGEERRHPNRPLGIALREPAHRARRLRVLLQIEVGPRQLQERLLHELPLGVLLEELGVRLDRAGCVARLETRRSQ